MTKAHILDGVAFTRFMKWVKENVGKIPMDEITASDYLEQRRAEQRRTRRRPSGEDRAFEVERETDARRAHAQAEHQQPRTQVRRVGACRCRCLEDYGRRTRVADEDGDEAGRNV